MFAFPDTVKPRLTMLAALLAVCAAVGVGVALYRIRLLPYFPHDGICFFGVPLLGTLVLGWLLPAHRARYLLFWLYAALLAWIIGLAGLASSVLLLLDALVLGEFTWSCLRTGADRTSLLHAALMTALGLAEIGLFLTGLSHFHVMDAAVYATAMVSIALLGHRHLAAHARALAAWLSDAESVSTPVWLAAGALFGAILLSFATSTFFGNETDTLGVYMYVPSYVTTYGGWSYDFHKYEWAVMPNLMEMLDSVPYMFSGPTGAQFFHSMLTVLTGLLIYAFCRPRAGTVNALLCAIGWFSLPLVIQESASLHNDVGLGLFLFAPLVYLHDVRLQTAKPWPVGLVAGLLVAAAVATKVFAWILCPVFLLVVIVWYGRRVSWSWAMQAAAAAMLAVVIFGGLQYWYAYAVTGNPVFPYYNAVFHSPFYPWTNLIDHSSGGHFNWTLPFLLTFHAELFGLGGPGCIGFQWLPLLAAALLLSLPGAGARWRWFGLAGLWYAALVMLPEQFVRYLIPALPFLSVFVGELGAQAGQLAQWTYRAVFICAIGMNVYAVQSVFYYSKDIVADTVFSLQDRTQLERAVTPMTTVNGIINTLEPFPVNVLYAAKGAGAGLKGTAYYVSWESPEVADKFSKAVNQDAAKVNSEVERNLSAAVPSSGIAAFLGAYRISYVVFDKAFGKGNATQPPSLYDFLQQHAQRITQVGRIELYRVDPRDTYPEPAVVNPGLDHMARGWSPFRFDKLVPAPGGGYLLENNQALFQGLKPGVVAEGRTYSLDVTASCLNVQGWIFPRIIWTVGKRRRVDSTGLLYFCSHQGPLAIHEVAIAPPGTVGATVGVSANSGAQAAVSDISVRY